MRAFIDLFSKNTLQKKKKKGKIQLVLREQVFFIWEVQLEDLLTH